MNLEFVAHRLLEEGWKIDKRQNFAGERYELMARRFYGLSPWKMMIKVVPVLDIFTLNRLRANFEFAMAKFKSNTWHRNLVIYVLSEKVTQQALHVLKIDTYNFGRFRDPGLGLRQLYVIDEKTRQVSGPYPPPLPHEHVAPFDLGPIFIQAFSPDGAAYPKPPISADVEGLMNSLLPTSTLKLIHDSGRSDLGFYYADALRELGRLREEEEYLDALLPSLEGDNLARAQRQKAQLLMGKIQFDDAIWQLESAEKNATDPNIRASAIATRANAYAVKGCFTLAQSTLRQALQTAPDEPRVRFAQMALLLQMDQRLEARAVLERMPGDSEVWVNCYIDFELANIALLLGEFDEAYRLANSALEYSPEIIVPLFTLSYLAMIRGDLDGMQNIVDQIEARSPQADALPAMKEDLQRLRKRHAPENEITPSASTGALQEKKSQPAGQGKDSIQPLHGRLKSFPSLVQRRDYCGPCTVELVLRYWKGGLDLTNNEIAQRVKLPGSGTPIPNMTEYFHLLNFETLRCTASPEKLKQLVNNGYPVIVEERGGGQAHVTVVIGYDDEAGTIELQDPITHHILPIPVTDFNRLRHEVSESALIAFPKGVEHSAALARLGLFPDEVLNLRDQAELAFMMGNLPRVADLMQRAVLLHPQHGLAWDYWLFSLLQQWQALQHRLELTTADQAEHFKSKNTAELEKVRQQFQSVLERAYRAHPDAEFVHNHEGRAAFLDGDLPRALSAFQKAHEIDPHHPDNLASIAECLYNLRQVEQALEYAQKSVTINPGSPAGNVWMARCLVYLKRDHAEYFAKIGAELAPGWYLSHLALAEAHFNNITNYDAHPELHVAGELHPRQAAWQQVDTVLSQMPDQLDALVLRAYLIGQGGDFISARSVLEFALRSVSEHASSPMTIYQIYQALCSLLFTQNLLDEAQEKVQQLLDLLPGDPWALQFQASARFRKLIHLRAGAEEPGSLESEIEAARQAYLAAIRANQGEPAYVAEFLDYLLQLGDKEEAIKLAKALRDQYAEQPGLIYQQGLILSHAGEAKAAAETMIEAVVKENAVREGQDLLVAFYCILQGMGPIEGEKAISQLTLPLKISPGGRNRALGIAMSYFPNEKGQQARPLLEYAMADNPEDAQVIIGLANLAHSAEEYEEFARRAVMVAPHWEYVRLNLANYLGGNNRHQEVLELTTGHESESPEFLNTHLHSLLATGRYEEATRAAFFIDSDTAPDINQGPVPYIFKFAAESGCSDYQNALKTAEHALARFPEELYWYKNQCFVLCHIGNVDQAEVVLSQAKEKGMLEKLVEECSYWIAFARGETGLALESARRMQELEWKDLPNDKSNTAGRLIDWSNRYLVLLLLQGDPDEIDSYLDVVVKDPRTWQASFLALARMRANQLTLDFVEDTLLKKGVNEATRINAYFARLVAQRNLDDPKAEGGFYDFRDKYPLYPAVYPQLALYASMNNHPDLAASLAEQAIAYERSSINAWAVRGLIHWQQGEHEIGQGCLRRGWNRTTLDQRLDYPFWWLYFTLAGNDQAGQGWKAKTDAMEKSSFDQRLIAMIQQKLG